MEGTNERLGSHLGPESKVIHPFTARKRTRAEIRWVVSNKFWTSSGITAGIDMAAAFVKYWVELHVGEEEGKRISEDLLGVTEVMYVTSTLLLRPLAREKLICSASDQNEDPWAEYYKLL